MDFQIQMVPFSIVVVHVVHFLRYSLMGIPNLKHISAAAFFFSTGGIFPYLCRTIFSLRTAERVQGTEPVDYVPIPGSLKSSLIPVAGDIFWEIPRGLTGRLFLL